MEARRESADSPYQLRSHRPYRTRRLRGGRRSKVKPSTCLKLAGDQAHRRRGWTVAGRGNPLVPSFPWAMLLHVSYCYWSYHGQTLLWPCTQQPTIPRSPEAGYRGWTERGKDWHRSRLEAAGRAECGRGHLAITTLRTVRLGLSASTTTHSSEGTTT
jgi:hypothetical protein